MGFIGIRAIKKKQQWNKSQKQLSTTCKKKKRKKKWKARQYLQFISEKYPHCCQCSKRAQWLRWSTGPHPGLPSSCGAAAGHPGPSLALTPASPEEQKTTWWWLTANTGLNSLTVIFFLAVTCDLTKLWRLSSDPLTSGVMTNTVKWASSSRHTQSRIYSQRNLLSVNQSIILYSSIRNVVCSESASTEGKKTKQIPIHKFQ